MPIARVALPVATAQAFDYWIPQGPTIERGSVVRAQLGGRTLTGVVVDIVGESDIDPARVLPLRDVLPATLPADVLDVAAFVASYYQEPPGMALALAVPPLAKGPLRPAPEPLELTDAGRAALPSRLARAPAARALFEQLVAQGGLATVEFAAALPAARRQLLRRWQAAGWLAPALAAPAPVANGHVLNDAQRAAVDAIVAAGDTFATFLLFGITGSGKTDVYLAAADAALARGRQVLLLVPEINLTPQLVARLRAARPGLAVATLHSGLPDGERHAQWQAAASGAAQLVLGTRLAVFTPLPSLGLIVIDEEHDASYKQQDNVRYHARDVAIWRARRRGVPVVLGSATPSLESWWHAREGRYRRLDLPARADPRATLPRVVLTGNRAARDLDGVGEPMRDAIGERLARGEQALVFVNRRGYSPSLICAACKWEAECPRCTARLTTHRDPPRLRCHHCGHVERVPAACSACGNVDLLPLGFGTQRLERALASAFPQARIARVDRDSTRARHAFANVREKVAARELDLLVGTQMLAKGHDFPRLTLVGVLGADNALYSADFRATERLAALLMQVAGRAGRAGLPGEVIVQTDFPEHPVYRALVAHDYPALADALLAERRAGELPPFAHVALLAAEAHRREEVDTFLAAAHAAGGALVADGYDVTVFSPVPALLSRRAGFERGQVVVQSARRAALQRFLPAWRDALAALPGRRVRWAIDVDPAGFG